MKYILSFASDETLKKFDKGTELIVLGGMLFLRFICPSVVSPHLYGLSDKAPSGSSMRTLIMLSMVMQMLANQTEFSKEKGHSLFPFNEMIIQKYRGKINDFMIRLSDGGKDASDSLNVSIKTKSIYIKQINLIYNIIIKYKKKILEKEALERMEWFEVLQNLN